MKMSKIAEMHGLFNVRAITLGKIKTIEEAFVKKVKKSVLGKVGVI